MWGFFKGISMTRKHLTASKRKMEKQGNSLFVLSISGLVESGVAAAGGNFFPIVWGEKRAVYLTRWFSPLSKEIKSSSWWRNASKNHTLKFSLICLVAAVLCQAGPSLTNEWENQGARALSLEVLSTFYSHSSLMSLLKGWLFSPD